MYRIWKWIWDGVSLGQGVVAGLWELRRDMVEQKIRKRS